MLHKCVCEKVLKVESYASLHTVINSCRTCAEINQTFSCNSACSFFSFLYSLYLFKLGLAPQIADLYGKVAFTGE